jgi:hypothetical protein
LYAHTSNYLVGGPKVEERDLKGAIVRIEVHFHGEHVNMMSAQQDLQLWICQRLLSEIDCVGYEILTLLKRLEILMSQVSTWHPFGAQLMVHLFSIEKPFVAEVHQRN